MSIIAHVLAPEQDEFATRAVITILTNAAKPYEDNLRRNIGTSRDPQQRIVNRIHALTNALEAQLAQAANEQQGRAA